MAGGDPREIYNIFGMKIMRYKVVLGMLGIYAGTVTAIVSMNKMKEKKITFESPEQEKYVNAYIKHAKEELAKPQLLRTKFVYQE